MEMNTNLFVFRTTYTNRELPSLPTPRYPLSIFTLIPLFHCILDMELTSVKVDTLAVCVCVSVNM